MPTPPTPRAGQWQVYLLRRVQPDGWPVQGKGNRLYYVGITNNFERRLSAHNAGKVTATKGHQWGCVAILPVATVKEAAILEGWLKNGDTRQKREAFAKACGDPYTASQDDAQDLLQSAYLWQARRALAAASAQTVRKVA